MVIQATEFLCGIGRLPSIELRNIWAKNRCLSLSRISQSECSCGAFTLSPPQRREHPERGNMDLPSGSLYHLIGEMALKAMKQQQ